MRTPSLQLAALAAAAALIVPALRADAQERAQRTGYWASYTLGTGLGVKQTLALNLVRRSRTDGLLALGLSGAQLDHTPHRVAGDTSAFTNLGGYGLSLGRWWPHREYAIRALGGLAYARKTHTTVVWNNSEFDRYASKATETLSSGPAVTGSLGAEWTGTRVVWFGVELNGMAGAAGVWLGVAASISLGRRD